MKQKAVAALALALLCQATTPAAPAGAADARRGMGRLLQLARRPAAGFVSSQFERHLASDTYWTYSNSFASAAYLPALARPYPMEVSGTLDSYGSDFDALQFTAVWKENPAISAPTRIYLPKAFFSKKHRIELLPMGTGYKFEFSGREGNQYLIIPPTGKAVERSLTTLLK